MTKRKSPSDERDVGCDEVAQEGSRTTLTQSRRQRLVAFKQWLRATGCWWDQECVDICTGSGIAGWGCLARSAIKKNQVLFTIPPAACFGAVWDGAKCLDGGTDDEMGVDSQERVATMLLQEYTAGPSSKWGAKLGILDFKAPCPWTWPEEYQKLLDGTELEPVLKAKAKRLAEELCNSSKLQELGTTFQDYAEACAVVASHANPWYGTCLCPFNDLLNMGSYANVFFDQEQAFTQCGSEGDTAVVGRAIRNIAKGEELTQEYCESNSELLYRYGFIPKFGGMPFMLMDEDAVGLPHPLLVEVARTFLPTSCTLETFQQRRLEALKFVGLIGDSTWEGVDRVTAELQKDGVGTARLVGACLFILIEDHLWELCENALQDMDMIGVEAVRENGAFRIRHSDEDADSVEADRAAATLICTLMQLPPGKVNGIQARAVKEGRGDKDVWPMLLSVEAQFPIHPNLMNRAKRLAREVVQRRKSMLSPRCDAATASERDHALGAMVCELASTMKSIETAILDSCLHALSNNRLA